MPTRKREQPKATQEAADYDRWFRAKAQAALDGLADGTNRVLRDEEVDARRAALQARVLALNSRLGT
jgi:hypothetical protein